jgi:enoyl-CoA hydratase/carnithine racemase
MTGDDASWDRIPFREWSTDGIMRQYQSVVKLLEGLVFNVGIPTIAAINGPGPHTEFALACDLTLCTPDVDLFDPHFVYGVPPGDGMYLVMQELIGLKRSTYHAYTGKGIDGATAVQLGLVNEVLPREQLLPRAWELAEMMMRRPRGCRTMTSQIVKRRWKQLLVQDLEHHAAHQHYDMVAERETGRRELLQEHGNRVPQLQTGPAAT